ncbi:FHA domain-containing protein [Planctomicrobium sp. SH668]|uniref:FHA domain-containing protein n=1 Tax=Planctomicrobium sp. SH668 TaxID=3448126 RepID=UPI003F5B2C59
MAQSQMTLEIQTGKYKGRRVKLVRAETVIGRGEESEIRIASAEVSREHCRLSLRKEGVVVRDLDSRNGTFVDGRPIEGERILRPGGTLTVGPLTFVLSGNGEVVEPVARKVAIQGKLASPDALSDADIVGWLSDYEIPTVATTVSESPTETAIVAHKPAAPRPPVSPPAEKPLQAVGIRNREFKSVAEEARDIIRRHLESVAEIEGERSA